MREPDMEVYRFGSFVLNPSRHALYLGDGEVPLTPRSFEVLVYLARNPGRLITKEEVLKAIWPDSFVEEANLAQHVFRLRKSLETEPGAGNLIRTLPGRGYQFTAEVRRELVGVAGAPATGPAFSSDAGEEAAANGTTVERWRERMHVIVEERAPKAVAASGRGAGFVTWRRAAVAAGALVVAAGVATAILWRPTSQAAKLKYRVLLSTMEGDATPTGGVAVDRLVRQNAARAGFDLLVDSVVSDDLKQMLLPPGTPIRDQTALDVCQRENLSVLLAPTLVRDGSRSLLLVRALSCVDDSVVAQAQVDLSSSGESAAVESLMRGLAGQLQSLWPGLPKPTLRILDATTPSMEALRAFSMAEHLRLEGRYMESIPAFRRALLLDPSFALAAAKLGTVYGTLGETHQQREWIAAAFAERDHVDEEERLFVDTQYYDVVARDQRQRDAVLKLWAQLIHDAPVIPTFTSASLARDGRFDEALPEAQLAIKDWPGNGRSYVVLGNIQLALGHPEEAASAANAAIAHGYYVPFVDDLLVRSALVHEDPSSVESLAVAWRSTDMSPYASAALARIRMRQGRLGEAGAMAQQAAVDLRAQGMNEAAQNLLLAFEAASALETQTAAEAGTQSRNAQPPSPRADASIDCEDSAVSLALAGRLSEARAMVSRLEKATPSDQRLRDVVDTIVAAAAALQMRQPQRALETLQSCATFPHVRLECAWLAGMAQLELHQDAAALASFADLEKWQGVDAYSTLPVLARWEQARLLANLGQPAKARDQYAALTEAWKSADGNLHLLTEVRAEASVLR